MRIALQPSLVLALVAAVAFGCGDDSASTEPEPDVVDAELGDASGDGTQDSHQEDGTQDSHQEDGTQDTHQEDGVEPDCIDDADCDNGLFCDGVETCIAGACAGGAAPDPDDGVDCTRDQCDEEADSLQNIAVTSECSHLTGAELCDANGNVSRVVGVCDLEAGCLGRETLIHNCADPLPDPACTGSAEGGDLAHLGAPTCDNGGGAAACGQVGQPCDGGSSTCVDGELTTTLPTCDPGTGCDTTASTETCPAPPNRCLGPVWQTYAPECADSASCGPGVLTQTTCPTPATSCEGKVHTVWGPTCDAASGCDALPVGETDCAAMEASNCATRTLCACDAVSGCSCSTHPRTLYPCPIPYGSHCCADGLALCSSMPTCVDQGNSFTCESEVVRGEECPNGCCTAGVWPNPTTKVCCP